MSDSVGAAMAGAQATALKPSDATASSSSRPATTASVKKDSGNQSQDEHHSTDPSASETDNDTQDDSSSAAQTSTTAAPSDSKASANANPTTNNSTTNAQIDATDPTLIKTTTTTNDNTSSTASLTIPLLVTSPSTRLKQQQLAPQQAATAALIASTPLMPRVPRLDTLALNHLSQHFTLLPWCLDQVPRAYEASFVAQLSPQSVQQLQFTDAVRYIASPLYWQRRAELDHKQAKSLLTTNASTASLTSVHQSTQGKPFSQTSAGLALPLYAQTASATTTSATDHNSQSHEIGAVALSSENIKHYGSDWKRAYCETYCNARLESYNQQYALDAGVSQHEDDADDDDAQNDANQSVDSAAAAATTTTSDAATTCSAPIDAVRKHQQAQEESELIAALHCAAPHLHRLHLRATHGSLSRPRIIQALLACSNLSQLIVHYGARHLGMAYDAKALGLQSKRDIQQLSRFLQLSPALAHLVLTDNEITDTVSLRLTRALSLNLHSTLLHLDLSHNQLTSGALRSLCDEYLSQPQCVLVTLDLSDNAIEDVRPLALCIAQGNCTLQSLRLRMNQLSDQSGEQLLLALSGQLSSDGERQTAPVTAAALQHELRELDLSANDLGPLSAQALLPALSACLSLTHLSYVNNNLSSLTPQGAQDEDSQSHPLMSCLNSRSCSHLQWIDVRRCGLSESLLEDVTQWTLARQSKVAQSARKILQAYEAQPHTK